MKQKDLNQLYQSSILKQNLLYYQHQHQEDYQNEYHFDDAIINAAKYQNSSNNLHHRLLQFQYNNINKVRETFLKDSTKQQQSSLKLTISATPNIVQQRQQEGQKINQFNLFKQQLPTHNYHSAIQSLNHQPNQFIQIQQLHQQNKSNVLNKKPINKLCLNFNQDSSDQSDSNDQNQSQQKVNNNHSIQSNNNNNKEVDQQQQQKMFGNGTRIGLKKKRINFDTNLLLQKKLSQQLRDNPHQQQNIKKRNVFLINFDNQDINSDDDSNPSLSDDEQQQQEQVTNFNGNGKQHILFQTTIAAMTTTNQDNDNIIKKHKPNILLTKFTNNSDSESSDDDAQQYYLSDNHNTNDNYIRTTSKINQPSQDQYEEHFHGQPSQQIVKTITITQFSHMLTTENDATIAYEAIPQHCVMQTIVKRYTTEDMNTNGNVAYEMFDSHSYKSIIKVKKVSEGYQMFWSKQPNSSKIKRRISKHLMQINTNREGKQNVSCGLITRNFFGTEFNCYRFNRDSDEASEKDLQRLITIDYQTNFLGLTGPRKMQVYIPVAGNAIVEDKALSEIYQQEQKQYKTRKQNKNQNLPSKKIHKYINRTPKWNSQICSYVLNFHGRATVSSVKNFIITNDSDKRGPGRRRVQEGRDMVVFGKIDKNIFNLDIESPFNIVQGLTLALSSFDKKIGCE